jgi:hypothetical protein
MCKPELGGELVSRDAHLNRRVVRTECWEPMAHAHWLCTKLHSVMRWKQLHCANEAGIRTLENFPSGRCNWNVQYMPSQVKEPRNGDILFALKWVFDL